MSGQNEKQSIGQDDSSQQKDNLLFPETQETSSGLFGRGEFQSDSLNLPSLNNQLGDHSLLNRPPIMQMLQFGDVADSINDSYLGKYDSLLQSSGTPIFGNYFEKLGFTQQMEQCQSVKPLDQSFFSLGIKDSLNPLSQSVFEKDLREQHKKQQEAEIQEQQIREQLEKENKSEAAENSKEQEVEAKIIESCKCSNSKCLKLYCICFSQGILCKDICSCIGCNNTANHEQEIAEARKNTLSRNPHAFTSKVEVISANVDDQIDNQTDALGYKKGCKCKKTQCRKKYCECFNAGVKCTFLCVCEDCLNKEDDKFQQPNQVEDSGKTSSSKNKKRKHAEQKGDSDEEEESESTVSKKSRARNKPSKRIQKSQKDVKNEEEEGSLASSVS